MIRASIRDPIQLAVNVEASVLSGHGSARLIPPPSRCGRAFVTAIFPLAFDPGVRPAERFLVFTEIAKRYHYLGFSMCYI